ncbi:MAG: phosphate ABC transporter permease PstA [Chloroflexi bacterium]|nr:phosphate ABC transporter permease PstA [Chloroflexota bacterium]
MKRQHSQLVAFAGLWFAASLTIVILAIIIMYILAQGLPYVNLEFLTGRPLEQGREGGIFPTILGTLALGAVSLVLAVPLGVGAAVFLTEYTRPSPLTTIMRFGTDSLAGVPSIIFGLFGFIFFVTRLHMSWSLLAGGLTLALMVLPTIIRTTEEAIRAVPVAYREVSYGLGASRWQMVRTVVLPNALPGIITGIILSFGRAVGETAAVIFTAGTALNIPTSILSPTRTMAVHFYILAVEGISLQKAYATGAVLIISILAINVLANALITRSVSRAVRR